MGKIVYTDDEWLIDQGTPLWGEAHEWPEAVEEMADLLAEAMGQIWFLYAECVEMRMYGRLTYAQIAEEMGWYDRHGNPAKNYAYEYTQRGLRALRINLEKKGLDLDGLIARLDGTPYE